MVGNSRAEPQPAVTAWQHHWLLVHCWLVRARMQPRHVATLRPPHPVILAQARIPARSEAPLDPCLRRNDEWWVIAVQSHSQPWPRGGTGGYWCTVGWCARGYSHDMSQPYDPPTPPS